MTKMTEEKRRQYQEVKEKWKAEHTERVTIRLNNRTDADILSRLKGIASKQGEIKKLFRLGMEYEKLQKEGTAPTPVSAPQRQLKHDYGFERTASGLPDLRKVKRWNEEEKKEEEKEK